MNFNPGTVVWKYPLKLDADATAVLTFAEGSILYVAMRPEGLQAWVAVINLGATIIRRRIVIVGTGHPLPEGPQVAYLNTFFDGPFVFHVFVGPVTP